MTVQHAAPARLAMPIAIGITLSLASLPLHLWLSHQQSVQLAGLVVAAVFAIYVGFALQSGTRPQMAVEIGFACAGLALAVVGLWVWEWAIPLGYAAHGVWDWAHHYEHDRLATIPRWYPPFCAAVDWVIAAGLAAIWLWHG